MTTALPEKIPLELPPGEPAAIEELVRSMAGAAHVLAVLAGDLEGPAATAPRWIGDDAAAAAAQVGRVRDLVREVGGAVLIATGHLSAHADRLRDVRRQVEDLRAEQDDDHAVAWSRWSELEVIQAEVQYDGAGAEAVAEDLRASEAARGRRHAALLAEVEDDAAATARALVDACVVVGGTGRRGDDARTLAHLALLLPGWGDAALTARGTAVSTALVASGSTPDDIEEAARAAGVFAGNPTFATALLAGIGTEGVRYLLATLGQQTLGAHSALATLLSATFGAAVANGRRDDPVEDVLGADYASHPEESSDVMVTGMSLVLVASSPSSARLRRATVATWARQMLLVERAPSRDLGGRPIPHDWPAELVDPQTLALSILSERNDPAASAGFLADHDVWRALLFRKWSDGGAALGGVVEDAGRDSGARGALAVRTGLETIGTGLTLGDPSNWTISRDTVAAVSPALARAVAAHVGVAVEALSVGVDGRLGADEDALRGLAYVTVERRGAEAMQRALVEWSREQVTTLEGTGPVSPLPAVAVPSAYVAVREYGQRLTYALDGLEAKKSAEVRERVWDCTLGAAGLLRGGWGVGAGLIEGYAAIALDMDGTWEMDPDRGLHFGDDDAVDRAAGGLSAPTEDAAAVEEQARGAFDRTIRALGAAAAPESPRHDYLEPLLDLAGGTATERLLTSPFLRRPGPR